MLKNQWKREAVLMNWLFSTGVNKRGGAEYYWTLLSLTSSWLPPKLSPRLNQSKPWPLDIRDILLRSYILEISDRRFSLSLCLYPWTNRILLWKMLSLKTDAMYINKVSHSGSLPRELFVKATCICLSIAGNFRAALIRRHPSHERQCSKIGGFVKRFSQSMCAISSFANTHKPRAKWNGFYY